MHVRQRSKAEWVNFTDGLPQFEGARP